MAVVGPFERYAQDKCDRAAPVSGLGGPAGAITGEPPARPLVCRREFPSRFLQIGCTQLRGRSECGGPRSGRDWERPPYRGEAGQERKL